MDNFESIKDKARRLIHDDAKKDAHIIQERQRDRANFLSKQTGGVATPFDNIAPSYSTGRPSVASLHENYDDGEKVNAMFSQMDARMNALMESTRTKQNLSNPNVIRKNMKNSKLPKEILESFSENYIDQEAPILDQMGVTNGEQQIIQEEIIPSQNNGIDYGLIKNIIESSVKKYTAALYKKMINESKSNDNNIAAVRFTGDKFAIITKNGDLYEANMTFKKNVKE